MLSAGRPTNSFCDDCKDGGLISTGMKGFSVFAAAQGYLSLPLQLLSFSGEKLLDKNILSWITQSE